MKLDRNINADGRGKYGIVNNRKLREYAGRRAVEDAIQVLEQCGIIDWGTTVDSEFFVVRLRDKYADDALFRYALSARLDGEDDYAREIEEMAERAGVNHPNCKKPD